MLAGYAVLVCLFIPVVLSSTEIKKNETKLLPFMPLAHGLRSGPITILDPHTIFIENLYYDGKAPDAHFWVGNGSWPFNNGTLVPDENGSVENLSAYDGKNVTIKLPSNVTASQIDYLAVWCIAYKHNFGHTYLKKKAPDASFGVRLEPFSQLAHGLRSGPIVAVNKKTFYIPYLYYDGKGPDAYFWVGKGTEPSPTGIKVHDETGSSKPLSEYHGQSVYVTLPHNVTTDDIDYFGVWCVQYKHNFGHTLIPKDVPIPKVNGNPFYTYDNKEIVRVKKCCPFDQVLQQEGCSADSHKFNLTINVRERTDSYALKNLEFVPFVDPISCKHKTYPLDPKEDSFMLLTNGSLAVLDPDKVHAMDEYCFESVNFKEDDKDRWVTTPFLCFSGANASVSNSAFVLYAVGILLSSIFLILTALVFLFLRESFDARDKCIVFYSSSMAVVFVSLVVAQFSQLNEDSCVVIAYTIQFFLVSSFTWLSLISTETFFKIIYYNSEAYSKDAKRLSVYLPTGIFLPMFSFAISLLVDQIPDIPTVVLKQHFGRNNCWFEDNEKTYYYVSIAIVITYNIVLGLVMKMLIVKFDKERSSDIAWITLKSKLKLMFRSGCLLLTLMSTCWISEVVTLAVGSEESIWLAIDIINSIQGLIVFVIFVAHRSVSDRLRGRRRKLTPGQHEIKPLSLQHTVC